MEFGEKTTRSTCILSIKSNMYKLKVFYDLYLFIFVILENVQFMTITKYQIINNFFEQRKIQAQKMFSRK